MPNVYRASTRGTSSICFIDKLHIFHAIEMGNKIFLQRSIYTCPDMRYMVKRFLNSIIND